jgi:hypothetical protein
MKLIKCGVRKEQKLNRLGAVFHAVPHAVLHQAAT